MSLSLIFRLQAAFAALWAIQLIFLPGMMFAQYQWTPSLELVALGGLGGEGPELEGLLFELLQFMVSQGVFEQDVHDVVNH